jgi:hypothetical protein
MTIDWKEIDGTTDSGADIFDHPYKEFEGKPIWNAIDSALGELIVNGDIEQHTYRKYVVGYLCKRLHDSKLITPAESVCGFLSLPTEQ